MAKRKRYLPAFLKAEGMRDQIENGIRELSTGDTPQRKRLLWWYLEGVEVKPTRALRKMGSACFKGAYIKITTLPLSAANRRDVIAHEVAHLVADFLHADKIKPHGPEWKRVAVALGAEPAASGKCSEFHEAALVIREKRLKIVARCSGCGFEILATRRTQKYTRTLYKHKPCGGYIEPVD